MTIQNFDWFATSFLLSTCPSFQLLLLLPFSHNRQPRFSLFLLYHIRTFNAAESNLGCNWVCNVRMLPLGLWIPRVFRFLTSFSSLRPLRPCLLLHLPHLLSSVLLFFLSHCIPFPLLSSFSSPCLVSLPPTLTSLLPSHLPPLFSFLLSFSPLCPSLSCLLLLS